jgi:DHA1 family multidrug resistance protein-like MFS transporter
MMVAAQTMSAVAFTISTPFLPFFIQQLGVHPLSKVLEWSGICGSINFLMAALVSPLWGALADRYGRKSMVVRSSIFGAISSVLIAASLNVWQLLGARAVMGTFSGFNSAATALVAAAVPGSMLGFALGWMATGQMTGSLIGPLIGGLIADSFHDYRPVYYATAIGVVICGILTYFFVHENFTPKTRAERKSISTWTRVRTMLAHPEVLPLLVILFLGQLTTMAVQPVIPLYTQEMVGNSPYLATFAGASFAVMGIADLIASPLLGKRSDQIGYRRVVLICLLGAGLFTIPQAFAHNIWVFLSLRFGVGLFLGGVVPTASAWIGRLFSADQRGLIFGLSYSASFGGMFVGPLAGGYLSARFGFGSAFIVTGALLLVCLVYVVFGARRGVVPAASGATT